MKKFFKNLVKKNIKSTTPLTSLKKKLSSGGQSAVTDTKAVEEKLKIVNRLKAVRPIKWTEELFIQWMSSRGITPKIDSDKLEHICSWLEENDFGEKLIVGMVSLMDDPHELEQFEMEEDDFEVWRKLTRLEIKYLKMYKYNENFLPMWAKIKRLESDGKLEFETDRQRMKFLMAYSCKYFMKTEVLMKISQRLQDEKLNQEIQKSKNTKEVFNEDLLEMMSNEKEDKDDKEYLLGKEFDMIAGRTRRFLKINFIITEVSHHVDATVKFFKKYFGKLQDYGVNHAAMIIQPFYYHYTDSEIILRKNFNTGTAYYCKEVGKIYFDEDKFKNQLGDVFDKVFDVLIRWNVHSSYARFRRVNHKKGVFEGNCQHFVNDVFRTLFELSAHGVVLDKKFKRFLSPKLFSKKQIVEMQENNHLKLSEKQRKKLDELEDHENVESTFLEGDELQGKDDIFEWIIKSFQKRKVEFEFPIFEKFFDKLVKCNKLKDITRLKLKEYGKIPTDKDKGKYPIVVQFKTHEDLDNFIYWEDSKGIRHSLIKENGMEEEIAWLKAIDRSFWLRYCKLDLTLVNEDYVTEKKAKLYKPLGNHPNFDCPFKPPTNTFLLKL